MLTFIDNEIKSIKFFKNSLFQVVNLYIKACNLVDSLNKTIENKINSKDFNEEFILLLIQTRNFCYLKKLEYQSTIAYIQNYIIEHENYPLVKENGYLLYEKLLSNEEYDNFLQNQT